MTDGVASGMDGVLDWRAEPSQPANEENPMNPPPASRISWPLLVSAALLAPRGDAQTIRTFAGGASPSGPATTVELYSPAGLGRDSAGNVYVADSDAGYVYKVTPQGTLSVFAGNGGKGYSGDGGPATRATLFSPQGVVADAAGNVYVADYGNARVRRIDADTGFIRTFAGGGYPADGLGDGGPANVASLGSPVGLALGPDGDLYIGQLVQRVRRVSKSTGLIRTVAGTGTEGFSGDGGPATQATFHGVLGIAVDGAGNLFVADAQNGRVRRVDAQTAVVRTIAGNGTVSDLGQPNGDGGPATLASLSFPSAVALEPGDGSLLVTDTYHRRVRRVALAAGTISTAAGDGDYSNKGDDGPATAAGITNPFAILVDPAGATYVGSSANFDIRVRKVAPNGTISTFAGRADFAFGDGGPATAARLRVPRGVAIDATGRLLIADTNHQRVRRVDPATGTITTVAGGGASGYYWDEASMNQKPAIQAAIGFPTAVARHSNGGFLIADPFNGRVFLVGPNENIRSLAGGAASNAPLGDGGPATQAKVDPADVFGDAAGNVYVADRSFHRIRKIDGAGTITTVAGSGPDTEGGYAGDGGPATQARLNAPHGVRVDAAGVLYIVDTDNYVVRRVGTDGKITTIAGGGNPPDGHGDGGPATQANLGTPFRIAFAPDGNLLVSQSGYDGEHRVRRVDLATGRISTVAGSARSGLAGDGGAATAARLHEPEGIAAAADGTLYVADGGNHRVRVVAATGGCALPTIGTPPQSRTIVSGQAAILDVDAADATAFQWYRGATGDTSTPIAGATSKSFTTPPLTASASYWVRVSNACGSQDSEAAVVAVASALADLSLTMSTAPNPVATGTTLTYSISVLSSGPSPATSVLVTDTLPANVDFVSAAATPGSCTGGATVTCSLGTLLPGAGATVTIRVTARTPGTILNTARVSAAELDPNPDDDSAGSAVFASAASDADLAVYASALPDPPRASQDLTVSAYVANAGPATVAAAAMAATIPAGTPVVSVASTQGTCTGAIPVSCSFGALTAGSAATVTIVLRPAATGGLPLSFRASGSPSDPNATNDTANLALVVQSNAAACPPPAPRLVSSPVGVVRAGDSFTITWSDVFGATDPDGTYVATVSTSSTFGSGTSVGQVTTRNLSASFPTAPGAPSTLFARVAARGGCGQTGGFSEVATINVSPNPPSLVVSEPPAPLWVVAPGGTPPPASVRFRNVGGAPASVAFRSAGGFFTFSPSTTTIAPGQDADVTLNVTPGATAAPGSSFGTLTADWATGTVVASVTLTVTGTASVDVRPTVDRDEVYLLRGPTTGGNRESLRAGTESISVTNGGAAPLTLVPSIGPGGAWLVLDTAPFRTPLAPGETRAITLESDPTRITSADYPLPIFTVLTLTPAGGSAADRREIKIFYGEAGLTTNGGGRGFVVGGEASFVMPTSVHATGVGGALFTSDGWIRNLSPDAVSVDLYLTPSGQNGQNAATKATQSIPGFGTLRLFDFVQGLFGSTSLAGPVEIRSRNFGQLSVRATANGVPGSGSGGGRFGTEIPVFGSGTGTGVGQRPLVLTGIKVTSAFRLNLILSETLGAAARVRLTLYDSAGASLATKDVDVPPSGNVQFPILDGLGIGGSSVESGSLVVEGVSGTGRVVAIGTLIDNASASFQSLSGRLVPREALATAREGEAAPHADPPPRVIPSIVHARGASGAFFVTELAITNVTAQPAVLRLVYDYVGSVSGSATADVTIGPRASLPASLARDAVVSLFHLPADSNTSGPMRIEGAGVARVVARATVTTPVDLNDASKGTKGSEFQSYTATSPESVGLAATPVATYPGLQRYAGIRTNLILTEVSGQAAQVRVRAINGTTGGVLGEIQRTLAPFEKVQINDGDLWSGAQGFGLGSAPLDRVAISLEPSGSASGRVVGVVTVIDNETASTRILVLAPPGPPGGSTIGF